MVKKQEEEPEPAPRFIGYAIWGVVALIAIIIIFGAVYTIPAGSRGVLLTFQKPSMIAMGEGLHFKMPLVQGIVKMNVQTQKYTVEKAAAASKDLQTVTTDVVINYYINPESAPEIYRNIGVNYQDKVIAPAVLEVLKASTAQYTAEELITNRPAVKEKIDIGLRDRLKDFGINVQATSITQFDFSAQFNSAIEGKVTAEQNALAAKNKLEQVKYEKEQRITQAEGEAEAIKIQAQAITQQGGSNYVELQRIMKWDGHYPQVMGSGVTPIIDMRSIVGGIVATNSS
jgi:regulator of protease activity HflC (stomatin/prohibitin superfamily)